MVYKQRRRSPQKHYTENNRRGQFQCQGCQPRVRCFSANSSIQPPIHAYEPFGTCAGMSTPIQTFFVCLNNKNNVFNENTCFKITAYSYTYLILKKNKKGCVKHKKTKHNLSPDYFRYGLHKRRR